MLSVMVNYYSAVCSIVWISLAILCALVHENNRLSDADKKRSYHIYILIFIACLAEYIGIRLNGNPNISPWFLRLAKCCDYIFTPMAGAAFAGQLNIKGIISKLIQVVIGVNIVFQIVCLFTSWMVYIDEQHIYRHGSLYTVYVVEYLLIIVLVVTQFLIYGKGFKNRNSFSLYLVTVLVIYGILMQELAGGDVKTAYLSLAIGAYILFIHTTEFSLQRSDEFILEQQIQIKTDALTGLLSRHAYSYALASYKDKMPDDFVAFSIDVNGLKSVNDTLGHEAGDELICGAAECIRNAFGSYGSCYRTGGDEFIVLASMNGDQISSSLDKIREETSSWHGKAVPSLSLSVGFAALKDSSIGSCEELVREADKMMYKDKDKYYATNNLPRRN